MPPLEDMSPKIIPSILPDPIEVDVLLSKDIPSEDDVMERFAPIQVQDGMLSTVDYVVEPKTNLKFKMLLSPIGYKEGLNNGRLNQVLIGVGARSVSIIKLSLIKIYAFGFYLNPGCLKAELGAKYRGMPPEDLKIRTGLLEDISRHELDMTVRLIVHHKRVQNGLVKSTFETALRNRLRRMKSNDEESVKMFSSYFTEELSLPVGTIIDFHWQPGGQFHTKVGDRFIGTIQSVDFCRAFFDIYIGESPVCNKARQEIGLKLAYMLQDLS